MVALFSLVFSYCKPQGCAMFISLDGNEVSTFFWYQMLALVDVAHGKRMYGVVQSKEKQLVIYAGNTQSAL